MKKPLVPGLWSLVSHAVAAAATCAWLLARVCVGAADLREEMHRLGLD